MPGNYDGVGWLDLSVKDSNGYWYTDLASNGFHGWDNVPGTSSTSIHNPTRRLIDYNHPWIEWTRIYEPDEDRNGDGVFDDSEVREAPFVNGHYQLKVGVRYTAAVRIMNGVPPWDMAGVEVNPDCTCRRRSTLSTRSQAPTTFKSTIQDILTATTPGGSQSRAANGALTRLASWWSAPRHSTPTMESA